MLWKFKILILWSSFFYRLEKEEWVQELPWACARSKTASVFSIWKRCTTRCSLVVAGENLYEGAEGRPHEYFSSPSQSQQVEAAADRECSDDKNLSTSFISVMRIATAFKYWKFKRLEITPFFYCDLLQWGKYRSYNNRWQNSKSYQFYKSYHVTWTSVPSPISGQKRELNWAVTFAVTL